MSEICWVMAARNSVEVNTSKVEVFAERVQGQDDTRHAVGAAQRDAEILDQALVGQGAEAFEQMPVPLEIVWRERCPSMWSRSRSSSLCCPRTTPAWPPRSGKGRGRQSTRGQGSCPAPTPGPRAATDASGIGPLRMTPLASPEPAPRWRDLNTPPRFRPPS